MRSRNTGSEIINFPTPVIAMINGYALAGGCELAVNCDIRIASENAHFGMPLAKRGILLNYGLVQRLVNAMGIMYTRELLFTGRVFDARKAMEIGLVNYVVPHDLLCETTLQMAEEIARNAPLAVRGFKKMVNKFLCLQKQIDPSEENLDGIDSSVWTIKAMNRTAGPRVLLNLGLFGPPPVIALVGRSTKC